MISNHNYLMGIRSAIKRLASSRKVAKTQQLKLVEYLGFNLFHLPS